MRLVTLEEHFTTEKYAEAAGADYQLRRQMPHIHDLLVDIGSRRVEAMDTAGIDLQILSFTGFGLYEMNPQLAIEVAHDANVRVSKAMDSHPGRFGGFAALAAQAPEQAAIEFRHCVKDLGFKGAMIDGTVEGQFLDHPRFLPVFEAAATLDVPIYLHPAPPPPEVRKAYTDDLRPPLNFLLSTAAWGWHVETGLHALRLMVSGLFDKFPKLKIILGHMGENLPYSIVRADAVLGRANLNLERSPLELFKQNFWITTSGYFSVPPVLCAKEVIGAERILLSVDYPFSEMEKGPRMLEDLRSDFTEREIQGFAYENSAKLLGL